MLKKNAVWAAAFSLSLSTILFHRPAPAQTLDDGLLDPSWFGPPLEFRKTEEIDYLWVKRGFNLSGRTLFVQPWEDPVMRAKHKRDAKDAAKATELTELFPARLWGALSLALDGIAQVSRKEGDIIVTGRVVDCNMGSKAAKMLIGMGAGSSNVTWDLKFVDRKTGELLLALHHRVISGTDMSEVDDKVIKWLEVFGKVLRRGAEMAWLEGEPAND